MANLPSQELQLQSTVALLDEARGGNDAAIGALYRRHLHKLRRWARGRLPRHARDVLDTDDLVQETLIKALHRLESLELTRTGAFQAYLRTAVLNGIRDELRRRSRRPIIKDTSREFPSPSPSPTEEVSRREKLDRYERALQKLKSHDREVIVARLELGAPYVDIARDFGKPSVDAARMAVTGAVLRLAQALRDNGDD